MINQFIDIKYHWPSTTDESWRKYYDYYLAFPAPDYECEVDSRFGAYYVYQEGNSLIVEVDQDIVSLAELANEIDLSRGYIHAESEFFSVLAENTGLDFSFADQVGALSEAPIFVEVAYLPDWIAHVRREAAQIRHSWSGIKTPFEMIEPAYPEYWSIDWEKSRIWKFEPYQIRSPLDDLIETGKAVFTLAE